MLKVSYTGCLDLQPFWHDLLLKMCTAAKNWRKKHQNSLFWGLKVVQGHQCWHH